MSQPTRNPFDSGAAARRLREKTLVRIVDDDVTVLGALRDFLEMDDWRVATFQSAELFLSGAGREPGCLILDVRMPGMTGIELQAEMKSRGMRMPIIFLSAHGDVALAVEAMSRGAMTFLEKPPRPEALIAAIEEAARLDLERVREAADRAVMERQLDELSEAEMTVARLVAKGLTNAVAAEALGVSERTVRAHRASIYQKLDVQNAVELAQFFNEIERLRAKASAAAGRVVR